MKTQVSSMLCSFSTQYMEKNEANDPTSQHAVSFLNKRNSDELLSALTMVSVLRILITNMNRKPHKNTPM